MQDIHGHAEAYSVATHSDLSTLTFSDEDRQRKAKERAKSKAKALAKMSLATVLAMETGFDVFMQHLAVSGVKSQDSRVLTVGMAHPNGPVLAEFSMENLLCVVEMVQFKLWLEKELKGEDHGSGGQFSVCKSPGPNIILGCMIWTGLGLVQAGLSWI